MGQPKVHNIPVPEKEFTSEGMLERMDREREQLIKRWGQKEYDRRRSALEENIRNQNKRKIASPELEG